MDIVDALAPRRAVDTEPDKAAGCTLGHVAEIFRAHDLFAFKHMIGAQHLAGRKKMPEIGPAEPAPASLTIAFCVDWRIIFSELALAAYAAFGLALAIIQRNFGPAFFLAACTFGFGYVAFLSFRETR